MAGLSFIHLGFLGASAAVAVAIVIHLLFRHRARRIELGTLQFLRVALRDHARRRSIRRWIFLALRATAQRAKAEKRIADLAGMVDKLVPGAGALRQAADKLQNAIRGNHTGILSRVMENKYGDDDRLVPSGGYNDAILTVTLALQAKIRELMLESALADRDGPVPPRYKEMVEDYYRVLSLDPR